MSPLTTALLVGCVAGAILGDSMVAYGLLVLALFLELVVAPALESSD